MSSCAGPRLESPYLKDYARVHQPPLTPTSKTENLLFSSAAPEVSRLIPKMCARVRHIHPSTAVHMFLDTEQELSAYNLPDLTHSSDLQLAKS